VGDCVKVDLCGGKCEGGLMWRDSVMVGLCGGQC